jgi:flagellar hook protein FlgE
VRHSISDQGSLSYTTSSTDLAVQGDGFLVVADATGQPFLTRAGSFVTDATTGNLVNSGGYTLLGYPVDNGTDPTAVLNGAGNLVPVNMTDKNLKAVPSTAGTFTVNLPVNDAVVTGDTPADNLATSTYSVKTSLVAYDNVGNTVTLDVYMTKTGTGPDTWEYSVFNAADAGTGGGFPYSSGPLVTQSVSFDSTGQLTGASSLSVPVPNGGTLKLDLSGTSELATGFTPMNVAVNGNAPSSISGVEIDTDGMVYASYDNGSRVPVYRVPLGTVASPDNLQPIAGDAFRITSTSGDLQIGFPSEGGRGKLVSGALEQSNVDMASELTDMIVAQRDYTANSKIVQTSSQLLDVLMSLK